jgi:hypothetical protein
VATAAKEAFCPILLAHGIATVVISYDGAGDDGQISEVSGFSADNTDIPIPAVSCQRHQTDFHGNVTIDESNLDDALQAFAEEALATFHRGWEDGDGACGEIKIDTATQSATLEHNIRVMDFEHSARDI